MFKVAVIGIGSMGRGHVGVYERLMAQGSDVELVAICDIDAAKLEATTEVGGNINSASGLDFSRLRKYTDYRKMLADEQLDWVDIALPTHLHAEAAIAALDAGVAVLCEKPMARSVEQCDAMIAAARRAGKPLMIAQCLRFWPAYEYLKSCVDDGRYGDVVSAYFFRGGSTPRWSWDGWLTDFARSGGVLLDQHVHDVDTIQWLFGAPRAVSTLGRNVLTNGGGYDAVSTHYHYADGKVVCAQDDWTINGDFGFSMIFRVNFTRGMVQLSDDGLRVYPVGAASFTPELCADDGYYREICAFRELVARGETESAVAPLAGTRETIVIALREQASADQGGAVLEL
ncbi:MAG: Gfo/Idh/MocA family oxidoreductase [Eubacteriales bacterium]|nr:Gfo/Idh/MocA family oxidoreductase [Eubacteriales bacterium]